MGACVPRTPTKVRTKQAVESLGFPTHKNVSLQLFSLSPVTPTAIKFEEGSGAVFLHLLYMQRYLAFYRKILLIW